MRRAGALLAVGAALALLAMPAPAHAGQLFIQTYGLAQIVENPGFAALATVLAVDMARKTLKLQIRRFWRHGAEEPRMWVRELRKQPDGSKVTHMHQEPLVLDQPFVLPVYQGVVWDDPHKSPIDRRVRDHLSMGAIKVGQEVVILGEEVVAASPAELRKLDLFFGGKIPSEYPAKASLDELQRDLHDFDLGELAMKELEARHALDLPMLLFLPPKSHGDNLLYAHWKALDEAGKAKLLDEAVALLQKKWDFRAFGRIRSLCEYELTPALLPPFARLALLLDGRTDRDEKMAQSATEQSFDRAWQEAKQPADVSVMRLLARRNGERRDGQVEPYVGLVHFHDGLSPAGRAALVEALLIELRAELAAAKKGSSLPWLDRTAAVLRAHPDPARARAVADLAAAAPADFALRAELARELVEIAIGMIHADKKALQIIGPPLDKLLQSDQAFMHTVKGDKGGEIEAGIILSVESQLNSNALDEFRTLWPRK